MKYTLWGIFCQHTLWGVLVGISWAEYIVTYINIQAELYSSNERNRAPGQFTEKGPKIPGTGGHPLDRVQRGLDPTDWKPMKSVGQGVREIRIQHKGQYRVIYVASFEKRIYVLHVFQKKTQKTGKQDLDTAKRALKEVLERQRS